MTSDILKQIWPEWEIKEKPLGKGSFGMVYKAVRSDYNVKSYAAIKTISIPSDPSEIDSLRSEGLDIDATKTLLRGIVDDFVNEIQLMESFKGVQNIVSIEDYKVVEKTEEIGWDIFIRMELLTTLNTYICDKKLSEEEVIKLGCDICSALEICNKRNIIHRDIKPENIFINDFGYFKLGDFGIARKMENLTIGLSQKGTLNYMAPEVAAGTNYDTRADIYSLGIVLYRLLNLNRLPFLDTEKQLLNPNERKSAIDRRLRGEPLPAPCDASPEMADVILRACAYDPNARFSSAEEMKKALMSVAKDSHVISGGDLPDMPSEQSQTTAAEQAETAPVDRSPSGLSSKRNIFIVIFSVFLAILGAGIIMLFVTNSPSYKAAKGIELAERFISEQNYEQAIIEYEKVLEIEPKNVDAYLKLAELHEKNGDPNKALEVLQRGLENTSDDKIRQKLDGTTVVGQSSSFFSSRPAEGSQSAPVSVSSSSGSTVFHSSSSSSKSSSSSPASSSSNTASSSKSSLSSYTNSSSSTSNSSRSSSSSQSVPTVPSGNSVTIQGMVFDIVQTTYLDLNDVNITNYDLEEISQLVNLTHLELHNNMISDITPLRDLTNLTYLSLRGNSINNISSLENLTELTYLNLNENQVSDITPLKNLTNLTYLGLYGNNVGDISSLQNLKSLTELRLDANGEIKDISALGNLKDLENLNLDENQVSNIVSLKNLTKLKVLYLNGNKVSDISSLKDLTNLKELWLGDNQITNIAPLENLTGLSYLNLSGNKLSSITPLSKLHNLTGINLGGTGISDITPLKNLTNLTVLQLENNQISDVSALEKLTKLNTLWLNSNKITSVAPLSKLTSLEILYLNNNRISDISPLSGLKNLVRLDFNQNLFTDITPLKYLTKLEQIDLCFNHINDISPLSNLTELEWLNLHTNQITDITPLSGLTNLTYLTLYSNDVKNIQPLAKLRKLTSVDLDDDNISETDKAWLRSQLPNCNVF